MKSGFLEKLIERLDRLDPGHLQTHFLRLARERGLMDTVFDAIQEGILVLDAEGKLQYANRAAQNLLGFSMERSEGHPVGDILSGVDWDRVLQLDEGEWANLVNRELEITYPRQCFINFYVVPLSAANPSEEGAVVILRDITRDREVQENTLESERLSAVMLLAAGVAHEIGNPLNSLTIHLQLLEREIEELPEQSRRHFSELVDIAHQEVTRLDQIINQFLRAVRPARPQFEKGSVLEELQDTVKFLKHEIESRDVLVEVDVPDDIPASQLDKAQIRQAFFNIIRNAIQAMPGGGVLRIRLSHNDQFAGIAFTDTGPGISPEDISHLFEPYHTTKEDGSGLGLMIVQRIVRDHGGEIEVRSEPGTGTTFSIFLPLDERRIRLLSSPRPKEDNRAQTTIG